MWHPRRGFNSLFAVLGLCAYFGSGNAIAQSDFGDRMKKWVQNEVPSLSKRLAQADFPVRINNIFVKATEENFGFVVAADIEMQKIAASSSDDPKNLDSMTVAQALALQASSFNAQVKIMELVDRHAALSKATASLETTEIQREFLASGAYNVASANLFSSYADIGNASAVTFRTRYPELEVSYSSDIKGDTTTVDMSPVNVPEEVKIARNVGIAAAAKWEAVSPYVMAVLMAHAIWDFHTKVEEYKRQAKTFDEAVTLFSASTWAVEEQAAFFAAEWKRAYEANKDVLSSLRSNNDLLGQRLRTLIAWNAARLAVSPAAITHAKLAAALGADVMLPSEMRVFSSIKNQSALSDLTMLRGYARTLEVRAGAACGDVVGVYVAEEYANAGAELQFLAEGVSKRMAFAPIKVNAEKMARDFSKSGDFKANLLKNVGSRKCAAIANATAKDGSLWQGKKTKTSLPRVLKVKVSDRSAKKMALYITATSHDVPTYSLAFCFTQNSGAGCSVQTAPNDGFINRFPRGGNVLDSSGDGGYAGNQASPTNATDLATGQLNGRINALSQQGTAITAQRQTWLQTNVASLKKANDLYLQMLEAERQHEIKYSASTHVAMQVVNLAISKFKQGAVTVEGLLRLHQDADISAVAPRALPVSSIRDAGPVLAALNPAEYFPANRPPAAHRLRTEGARFTEDMLLIEGRVKKASDEGTKDPVFKDGSSFYRLRAVGDKSLVLATQLQEEKPRMSVSQAARVDGAIESGLLNAKSARYYAWGYTGAPVLHYADVIDWRSMKSHIVQTVEEFLTCNKKHKNQGEMMETPCNVMVGTTLSRLYGITDFGANGQFQRANDIAAYVANSPKWTLVGPALSQDALDDAGMLAAKGRAVITVWANPVEGQPGHVNLILPGIPTQTATFRPGDWGHRRIPRVVNFHWCTGACDPSMDPLTFVDDTLDRAYQRLHPKHIQIYVRDRPNSSP